MRRIVSEEIEQELEAGAEFSPELERLMRRAQDASDFLKALGHGREYEYPHDLPGGVGSQRYLPDELHDARFYAPTDRGLERDLQQRLAHMRELRKKRP